MEDGVSGVSFPPAVIPVETVPRSAHGAAIIHHHQMEARNVQGISLISKIATQILVSYRSH